MSDKRIQLTLFVDESESEVIESVRKKFNPEQFALIKCHVTLCREDELTDLDKVIDGLNNLKQHSVVINFGKAIRFSEGKGVLLPASGDNEQYHFLRQLILQPINENIKKAEPHITLMHPRNSTCTDDMYQAIKQAKLPDRLHFKKISLIQQDVGKRWNVLQEFDLIG